MRKNLKILIKFNKYFQSFFLKICVNHRQKGQTEKLRKNTRTHAQGHDHLHTFSLPFAPQVYVEHWPKEYSKLRETRLQRRQNEHPVLPTGGNFDEENFRFSPFKKVSFSSGLGIFNSRELSCSYVEMKYCFNRYLIKFQDQISSSIAQILRHIEYKNLFV